MLKENGIEFIEFCSIEPNPESDTINKGGAIAREEKVDFLIGLGGGSVLDATKAISIVAVTEKPIWGYCEKPPKEKVPNKTLPILAVITVAATGSEADAGGVITNSETRNKRGIFGKALFPTASIIDPLLTLTIPQKQTIDGVVDMITHIFESYLSSNADAPVSDRVSEALIKEAMKQGEVVFKDTKNIEARESLSWISTLALSGFPSAGRRGPFPMHRMEHPISGIYHIAHGRGLAALMPAFLYHTKEIHRDRLKIFGKNVLSTDSPTKATERIVHWMKKINAFVSLKDLGVKREMLEKLADMAIADEGRDDKTIMARKPLTKKEILEIYNTAFNYEDLFRKV